MPPDLPRDAHLEPVVEPAEPDRVVIVDADLLSQAAEGLLPRPANLHGLAQPAALAEDDGAVHGCRVARPDAADGECLVARVGAVLVVLGVSRGVGFYTWVFALDAVGLGSLGGVVDVVRLEVAGPVGGASAWVYARD